MALSANRPQPNTLEQRIDSSGGCVVDVLVKASAVIYEGSFVGLTSGYARALVAGDIFVGISMKKVTGGASDGLVTCPVLTCGTFQHALTSVAVASIGAEVYASDDTTLTLVKTSNSSVGRIISIPATGTCNVRMKTVGDTQTQAASAT